MTSNTIETLSAHERLEQLGPRALLDEELVAMLLAPTAGANSVRETALRLLDEKPLMEMAWASPEELQQVEVIGRVRAAALVAAFDLGRRGIWAMPKRGERLQEPGRVRELFHHLAHGEREEFHVVLLDVRCRLLKSVRVSEGSLTQCPVSPRDVLREPLRSGAHGVIFVHNLPATNDSPSRRLEDEIFERLYRLLGVRSVRPRRSNLSALRGSMSDSVEARAEFGDASGHKRSLTPVRRRSVDWGTSAVLDSAHHLIGPG